MHLSNYIVAQLLKENVFNLCARARVSRRELLDAVRCEKLQTKGERKRAIPHDASRRFSRGCKSIDRS